MREAAHRVEDAPQEHSHRYEAGAVHHIGDAPRNSARERVPGHEGETSEDAHMCGGEVELRHDKIGKRDDKTPVTEIEQVEPPEQAEHTPPLQHP